jgi:hypothetical protein
VPPAPHGAFLPHAAFGIGPPKQRPGLTQQNEPLSVLASEVGELERRAPEQTPS